jgi:uncharacterized protein (DUF1800 family)
MPFPASRAARPATRSRPARKRASAFTLAVLLALGCSRNQPVRVVRPPPPPPPPPPAMATAPKPAFSVAIAEPERGRAIHLLSRTTYGVRPRDVEEIARMGRSAWLDRQLYPEKISDSALDARVASLTTPGSSPVAQASRVITLGSPTAADTLRAMIAMTAARLAAMSTQQNLRKADSALRAVLATLIAPAAGVPSREQAVALEREVAAIQAQLKTVTQGLATMQSEFTAAANAPAARGVITVLGPQPQIQQAAAMPPTPVVAMPAGMVFKPTTLFSTGSSLASHNTASLLKLTRAVYSERQLEEMMTDFWFNHFNVVYTKVPIYAVLADYEANAIRKHVFGKFEDMLVATAQHPAMMVYLDNYLSTATPPMTAAGQPVRGGLNENYARELMELHTLGVNGGYNQQDVIQVARAFTGWSIAPRTGAPVAIAPTGVVPVANINSVAAFAFYPTRHDSGAKTVMGATVNSGGVDEGLQILHQLAGHPSTANFIATKLVRHFVADVPPPKLVTELARVFRETDGDLRAVTRALFLSEEFYAASNVRVKVKRPFEFVASALRVTDAQITSQSVGLVTTFRSFRHLPYGEPAPTGYAVTAADWVSAGALLGRLNFALDLVAHRVTGVTLPEVAAVDSASAAASTASLVSRLLIGAPMTHVQAVIAEDLMRPGAVFGPRMTPGSRATALALGSPEFQMY